MEKEFSLKDRMKNKTLHKKRIRNNDTVLKDFNFFLSYSMYLLLFFSTIKLMNDYNKIVEPLNDFPRICDRS